ncbi:MAG: zinc/manganese transport system permease protein [Pseudomonadota bacterium]|nr:zinc/manganese transport system permease protein [Pseudomonadota bacterium]
MMDALTMLFDPLFIQPFFTGLAFAFLLPLFGAYLRLRDEWLAALAFAQTAAAGSLLAMVAGWPLMFGGLLAAAAAAALKSLFETAARGVQGAAYAMLLVAGWGISVLLVANLPLAERLGHALFDGQLYFTDTGHLVAALVSVVVFSASLSRLSRGLLLAHFFPDFFRARGRSARQIHLFFDLLVAGALALATMSVGVMAAFAMVFVPPLVAWGWSASWRRSLLLAVVVGVTAYLVAFAGALLLDQPFGPVLAIILVFAGAASGLAQRLHFAR